MMHEKLGAPFLHRASRHLLRAFGAGIACVLLIGSQASVAAAPAIAQSFQAGGEDIALGSLVGVKQGSPRTIELSNSSRAANLVGVVAKEPLVTLGGEASSVEVVTSGVTTVLVSNINGSVESGDKITASPINGVGMKATEPILIAGTAQAALSEVDTKEHTVRTEDGQTKTIQVGKVPIDVSVTFYAATEVQEELVPPFIQNVANTIAGKPVSPVRIIASFMVLVLALISVGILLYSSVKSSIISIGRNPLSEGAVHKSLIEVGLTVIGILLLTFIAVYLILVT